VDYEIPGSPPQATGSGRSIQAVVSGARSRPATRRCASAARGKASATECSKEKRTRQDQGVPAPPSASGPTRLGASGAGDSLHGAGRRGAGCGALCLKAGHGLRGAAMGRPPTAEDQGTCMIGAPGRPAGRDTRSDRPRELVAEPQIPPARFYRFSLSSSFMKLGK